MCCGVVRCLIWRSTSWQSFDSSHRWNIRWFSLNITHDNVYLAEFLSGLSEIRQESDRPGPHRKWTQWNVDEQITALCIGSGMYILLFYDLGLVCVLELKVSSPMFVLPGPTTCTVLIVLIGNLAYLISSILIFFLFFVFGIPGKLVNNYQISHLWHVLCRIKFTLVTYLIIFCL